MSDPLALARRERRERPSGRARPARAGRARPLGSGLVVGGVGGPPRRERGVAGAHHDVARRVSRGRSRRPVPRSRTRSGARSSRASTAPIRCPRTSTDPGSARGTWRRPGGASSCPSRSARRSPSARPHATVQSTPSRIQRPSRRTPTPASRTTAGDVAPTGHPAQSDQAKRTSGARSRVRQNGHDLAGELADPGLLLARELAELLVEEVEPAAGDGRHLVVGEPGDRLDPARVDPLDRPAGRRRPGRPARAGHRGSRIGSPPPVTARTASLNRSSQVGSRPGPERQVGGEPAVARTGRPGRRSRSPRGSPAHRPRRGPSARPRSARAIRGSRRRGGSPGSRSASRPPGCRRPRAPRSCPRAVPEPPEMIAPAWPIRLPSGAVRPAMKAAIGTPRRCSAAQAAASSSAEPPISPMSTIASVSASAANSLRTSRKVVPMIGSPPIPTQVDWPMPGVGHRLDGLVGQGPRARHDPDPALAVDRARDDPDLGPAGRGGARAVRADEPGAGGSDDLDDLEHVEGRDPLGDAEDRADPGTDGLEDGVRRARRRDDRCRPCSAPVRLDRLGDRVEDRDAAVDARSGRPCSGSPRRRPGSRTRASGGRGTRPPGR